MLLHVALDRARLVAKGHAGPIIQNRVEHRKGFTWEDTEMYSPMAMLRAPATVAEIPVWRDRRDTGHGWMSRHVTLSRGI